MDDPTVTVAEWTAKAIERLAGSPSAPFERLPLDSSTTTEFLGKGFESPVSAALECYEQLIYASRQVSRDLMARLIIPLRESTAADTRALELDALLDQQAFDPPSLYLCSRRMFLLPNEFEEYRLPVERRRMGNHGCTHIYYTCSRFPLARERQWNYERAVWYDHYPEEFELFVQNLSLSEDS